MITRANNRMHTNRRQSSQFRCSGFFGPADALRDKSNAIGGWLPSLTFSFGDTEPLAMFLQMSETADVNAKDITITVTHTGAL